MDNITYIDTPGAATVQCKVRLGKKLIGAIYKTADSEFYYRPTGSAAGDLFPNLNAVKQSLQN